MNITEIMVVFKNPDTIHSLAVGEKLLGVGFTMILGMSITVIALVLLKVVMGIMSKVLSEEVVKKQTSSPVVASVSNETSVKEEDLNQEAVIAAITVALSAKLKTPLSNIIIKDIRRVNSSGTPWSQLGIVEQMNNRL